MGDGGAALRRLARTFKGMVALGLCLIAAGIGLSVRLPTRFEPLTVALSAFGVWLAAMGYRSLRKTRRALKDLASERR